jgi:stress response protein YsnF
MRAMCNRRGVMHTHTLVAVFPTRAVAEEVRSELASSGIPSVDIGLSEIGQRSGEQHQEEKHGFWDWLFGSDVPEIDRNWYTSTLDESRTAVSVRIGSEETRSKVEDILTDHSPITMEEDGKSSRELDEAEVTVGTSISAGQPEADEEERIIPIVKEELEVGKRRTEQRHRVRVYPVERRVQEQVDLRDETVVIERRPTSGRAAGPEDLRAREVEIIERHEEPVVAKTARAVEEVVVRKDVRNRTETIEDTVRETNVEVDREDGRSASRGSRRS